MKNRKLSALTALLLVFGTAMSMLACSSEPSDKTVGESSAADTSATEPAETAPGDHLPEYNANGASFTVLGRDEEPYHGEFLMEEETGDTIDDAVYRRNMIVEEKLNVDIKAVERGGYSSNYASFIEAVTTSILAGDNAYQLIGGYTYRFASSTLDGNFLDWYEIPYVELDREWWSGGFTEAASIGNHSYIATGDLSPSYLQFTFAIFYNKNLAKDFGIENIYDTVRNGEWTLDKMNELGELAVADMNGDGKMDFNDRFGFMTDQSTRVDGFLYAFEVPLSERDADGIPYIVGVTDKYQKVLEAINELLWESGVGYMDKKFDDHTMFADGLCLFTPNRLYDASTLREMEDDFGIIPYPKWDEEQKDYHTYYSDNCTGFAIPITVGDTDLVGIVTELMAAKSYELIRPAVYEVALKTKYSRDDDSAEMIDMILDTMIFDFTNIYAFSFGDQKSPAHGLRMNSRNNSNELASYFAQYEKIYSETMDKLVSSVSGE